MDPQLSTNTISDSFGMQVAGHLLVFGLLSVTLSHVVSILAAIAVFFRKSKPRLALSFSWGALALSCVGAISVALSIFYVSMSLDCTNSNEDLCAAFELKTNPHVHPKIKAGHPEDNDSATSIFWAMFTDKYPGVEVWSKWVTVGLCIGAVGSFATVIHLLAIKSQKKMEQKIKVLRIEFLRRTNKNQKVPECLKKNAPMIRITPDYIGDMKHCAYQPLTVRDLWTLYAALGVMTMAMTGVVFLNHYVALTREEALMESCVPLNYVPPAPKSSHETSHVTETSVPECHGAPFNIVSRDEWMANPPNATRAALKRPVDYVLVSHSLLGSCSSLNDCISTIRRIQEHNLVLKDALWDTSSNFFVARDGRVYEGAGWSAVDEGIGSNKNDSIRVMFIGTNRHEPPPKCQMKAFNDLINEGTRIGNIAINYKIIVRPKSKRSALNNLLK